MACGWRPVAARSKCARSSTTSITDHSGALALSGKLALERLGDQRAGLADAVKLDEGAEARALLLAEQHGVKRRKPIAQRLEAVLLADGVNLRLDLLGRQAVFHLGKPRIEIKQRRPLLLAR